MIIIIIIICIGNKSTSFYMTGVLKLRCIMCLPMFLRFSLSVPVLFFQCACYSFQKALISSSSRRDPPFSMSQFSLATWKYFITRIKFDRDGCLTPENQKTHKQKLRQSHVNLISADDNISGSTLCGNVTLI